MSSTRTWIVTGTLGAVGLGLVTAAIAAENDTRDRDAGDRVVLEDTSTEPATPATTPPGPVPSSFSPRSTVSAPSPVSTQTAVSAPTTHSPASPDSAPSPVSPPSPVSAPTPDSPASPASAPSPASPASAPSADSA